MNNTERKYFYHKNELVKINSEELNKLLKPDSLLDLRYDEKSYRTLGPLSIEAMVGEGYSFRVRLYDSSPDYSVYMVFKLIELGVIKLKNFDNYRAFDFCFNQNHGYSWYTFDDKSMFLYLNDKVITTEPVGYDHDFKSGEYETNIRLYVEEGYYNSNNENLLHNSCYDKPEFFTKYNIKK